MTAPSSEPPLGPGEGVLVVVLTLLFAWVLLPVLVQFVGVYR